MSTSSDNGLVFPARDAVLPDRPCPTLPKHWTSPLAAFVARARKNPKKLLVKDSAGEAATNSEALIAAISLACGINEHVEGSEFVGILLPPSKSALVLNLAVTLLGKIPINLNYSSGDGPINSAIAQTGLRTVFSTKKVLDKGGFKIQAQVVNIEDTAQAIPDIAKQFAWFLVKIAPTSLWKIFLPGMEKGLDDTASIMFTSGSTGEPKGVQLTNANLLYNIAQLAEHAKVGDEKVLGCLPYFHSYGFGVTLWAGLVLGWELYPHHNPLDARGICEFIAENGITAMATTPTFMRNYLKRGNKDQFATVKLLMMGSEKLKPELARDVREQLGKEPLEGYGCTETSPLLSSCNSFDVASPTGAIVKGTRDGSVGQMVPGSAIAVVDPTTNAILPRGRANEGRIFVNGPQIMKGYFNKPKETANCLQNGWYFTGDIGAVDEDGFVYLTDRESRFAKVGPEMVPLIRVEAELRTLAGVDELSIAVCAIPDAAKGEKLVVLYTDDKVNPSELTKALTASGMHALWIPKVNDFHKVAGPFAQTASGKLDLKAIKKIAVELEAARA
jgi:acyl-[acyl-carrier-protein]-phospholipid O-acyltransferase/long-chain-fatty-acid--[acyl-carrier-protein] ligase